MKRMLTLFLILTLALSLWACIPEGNPTTKPNNSTPSSSVPTSSTPPQPTQSQPPVHDHAWSQWETVQEVSCTQPGLRKRTCECGETETTRIESSGHMYNADGVCDTCGKRISLGLSFTLTDDTNAYLVSGMGTCTDTELILPEEHAGKPVIGITWTPNAGYDAPVTSIYLHAGITSVDASALGEFKNLTSIQVAEDNLCYAGLDGVLYTADMSTLIAYPQARQAQSFTVPEGVSNIAALSYSKYLTAITLPKSLTFVNLHGFLDCENLADILVSEGNTRYTSVGGVLFSADYKTLEAFPMGKSIGYYSVPDGVTALARNAFDSARFLETISLPASLTDIPSYAFHNAASLRSVEVHEDNPNYCAESGVLFSKDMTTLLLYPPCRQGNAYTVPEGVTTIGIRAFAHSDLSTVSLPQSVTALEERAFAYCNNLTSISMDGVLHLGVEAFLGCHSLRSLQLSADLQSLHRLVFSDSGLNKIHFDGTMAQWQAVQKWDSWDVISGPVTVVCTDGTLMLEPDL